MENLFTLGALAIAAIPLDVGIISALKGVGLPNRFAPIASIVVGIGLVALTGADIRADVAQGIIVGLAASGLFSGSKALFAPSDSSLG